MGKKGSHHVPWFNVQHHLGRQQPVTYVSFTMSRPINKDLSDLTKRLQEQLARSRELLEKSREREDQTASGPREDTRDAMKEMRDMMASMKKPREPEVLKTETSTLFISILHEETPDLNAD